VEKYGMAGKPTHDNVIRRMGFTCWITKATETQSEYVLFIAFSRQQRLREQASMLLYAFIASPVLLHLYVNQANLS
jgi:hypothetical protein